MSDASALDFQRPTRGLGVVPILVGVMATSAFGALAAFLFLWLGDSDYLPIPKIIAALLPEEALERIAEPSESAAGPDADREAGPRVEGGALLAELTAPKPLAPRKTVSEPRGAETLVVRRPGAIEEPDAKRPDAERRPAPGPPPRVRLAADPQVIAALARGDKRRAQVRKGMGKTVEPAPERQPNAPDSAFDKNVVKSKQILEATSGATLKQPPSAGTAPMSEPAPEPEPPAPAPVPPEPSRPEPVIAKSASSPTRIAAEPGTSLATKPERIAERRANNDRKLPIRVEFLNEAFLDNDDDAWRRNARTFDGGDEPRVAIVVTGLGRDGDRSAAAILDLPPEIGLSFAADAPNLRRWLAAGRTDGHEVMLDLPLQPEIADTAADPLLASLPPDLTAARLAEMLSGAPGAVGVVGFAGLAYGEASANLATVMRLLAERGMMLVDSGSVLPRSAWPAAILAAAAADVPRVAPAVLVDARRGAEAAETRLGELVSYARQRGAALALAPADPETIALLADWSGKTGELGVALAPASSVAIQQ